MRIEDGHARSRIDRAVKQQPLGREILLHASVIIEVVLGQVGEYGHVEVHASRASLVKRVA